MTLHSTILTLILQKSRYSQPSLGLKHVNTANATKKQNNLNSPRGGKLRREPRSNPFEKCPKWETTTTGTFKANWNARQVHICKRISSSLAYTCCAYYVYDSSCNGLKKRILGWSEVRWDRVVAWASI